MNNFYIININIINKYYNLRNNMKYKLQEIIIKDIITWGLIKRFLQGVMYSVIIYFGLNAYVKGYSLFVLGMVRINGVGWAILE